VDSGGDGFGVLGLVWDVVTGLWVFCSLDDSVGVLLIRFPAYLVS
jgi:hypothetical protein